MEQMKEKPEYTFDAFISYSHRNHDWGKWLQRKLETFPIPNDMRGDRPRGQNLRIFRDQTDLAGTGLQDSLRQNLDISRVSDRNLLARKRSLTLGKRGGTVFHLPGTHRQNHSVYRGRRARKR